MCPRGFCSDKIASTLLSVICPSDLCFCFSVFWGIFREIYLFIRVHVNEYTAGVTEGEKES